MNDDNDLITEMLDKVAAQIFDKVACPRCYNTDIITYNEDNNSYSCQKCGKRFGIEGLEV